MRHIDRTRDLEPPDATCCRPTAARRLLASPSAGPPSIDSPATLGLPLGTYRWTPPRETHPVSFNIWKLKIHTYGIGLAITFWFAFRYFERRLRNRGYPWQWLGRSIRLDHRRRNRRRPGRPRARQPLVTTRAIPDRCSPYGTAGSRLSGDSSEGSRPV